MNELLGPVLSLLRHSIELTDTAINLLQRVERLEASLAAIEQRHKRIDHGLLGRSVGVVEWEEVDAKD